MKNFARVLSVVMAIAMLFTMSFTASAATYTDVATEDSYYEAVEALSALGVVKGYEAGDFQPDGKITRAEAATIIMRIMGMGAAESSRVNTQFSDVQSDHWASGVIAAAADSAIVNGMGDGTFAPAAEVTYDQVVKMLVCAMGYEMKAKAQVAAGTNVFPTGYNIVANQKRITEGTTKSEGGATRATVARLVYNALKVNLMDQTSFGTDVEFKEVEKDSILYTKLNAIEVETKLTTVSIDPSETKVTLAVSKYDDVAVKNGYGSTKSISSVKKGDVDLAGLQGLTVKALIDITDSNDPVLLAVFPQGGKNVELAIDPQLFDGIVGQAITYYKDADATTVNSTSKIAASDAELDVYMNMNYLGKKAAATAETGINAMFKLSGSAKINTNYKAYRFVDTNNDGYYDTLFVDNAASFVVGKINAEDFEIYRDNSSSIFNSNLAFYGSESYSFSPLDLDTEDDKVSYSIKDDEGKELAFEDINIGDILTVAMSKAGDIYYYDITVSSSAAVEGTISEISDVKVKGAEDTITYYTIDGVAYRVNARANDSKLEAGATGVFQVTADGAIISYELEASSKNYGIVIAVANKTGSFSNGVQLQVVTADGTIKTFDYASKVYKNGADDTAIESRVDADADTAGFQHNAALDVEAGTIVIYETNADDEIKKIYTTVEAIQAKDEDVKVKDISSAEYAAATGKIDGTYITEDTIVIGLPTVDKKADKDSYTFASAEALADAESYNGTVIYDTSSKEVKLAFITNLVVKPAYDTVPFVVTGKSTTRVGEDIRNKYTGYIENKEVSYVLAADEDLVKIGMAGGVGVNALEIGVNDIIQIVLNANEEIVSYRHILNWVEKVDEVEAHYEALLSVDGSDDGSDVDANEDTDDAQAAKLYNLNTMTAVSDTATVLYGYAVAGKANKVSARGIELFKDPAKGNATDLLATSNIIDAAYNPNAIVYSNGKTYSKVQIGVFDSVKTFDVVNSGVAGNFATDLAKVDDVIYLYSFDGVNVLGVVVDVLSNNK